MDDSDSIKTSLLLFDKIFVEYAKIETIEKLVIILPHGKELLKKKLNEIEQLEKHGLVEFFDLKQLGPIPQLIENPSLKHLFNRYQESYDKIHGIGERNKDKDLVEVFAEFMTLDRTGAQYSARFKSAMFNLLDPKNEYIPIIKSFETDSKTDWEVSKETILNIVFKKFPVIPVESSIDDFIAFKSNSDIKLRYYELRDFITTISKSNLSLKEIEDKIEYLYNQYIQSVAYFQKKYKTSILETMCIATATIIEDMVKFKYSDLVKKIFEIKSKKYNLIEAERNLKGRELSYIYKVNELK